ncbi:UDP-N-acetylglucosamine 4,6-dehydratase family protein [Petroclostridium xylanilyticum]|uniref:UDP-N-acetylglucosamine 4,6-dehydratase family protein n=1 Tax=Petroclostridium xylanilyticum TaxID=1792311 RepID=UPI001FA8835F|nr:UDP-N-acetylglucosamine 4,6-dehydratase family protein [Petroclostridium xylanilyticum]
MKQLLQDKNILVIGGTGTIGQALTLEILKYNPKVVRIYSRDEYKQFIMQQKLGQHSNIRFLLGDIRDKERLGRAMHGIDIVFHLAALKHVPACEYNPFEAVKTNVMGTQNVIDCAINEQVERVIYTSTDKAINPTNTMGATKLLAERLIAAADYSKGGKRPIFAAVRFGNVMGSRGSVVPLFKEQILKYRYITVTDPEMTRFMMSITEAVNLVLKASLYATGGEVFVLKMPVVRLGELAEAVIEEVCEKYHIPKSNVQIKQMGLRPGEKMYEELMTDDEYSRAEELDEMFRISPIRQVISYNTNDSLQAYITDSSKAQEFLMKEKIKKIIRNENLL